MGRNASPSRINAIYNRIYTGRYYVWPTLSVGALLVSNGAVWTKGVYTEILPVNSFNFQVFLSGIFVVAPGVPTEFEIDISVGLAGSETVIATIPVINTGLTPLAMPILVSIGNRISGRCADSVGGSNCRVKIMFKT